MNLRIVTVTPKTPFDLGDDERILERTSVYGDGAPAWNLLVAKGVSPEEGNSLSDKAAERETRSMEREARLDAQSEQTKQAFAAGLAAFAAALGKAPS